MNGPTTMCSIDAAEPNQFQDWLAEDLRRSGGSDAAWRDGEDVFAPRSFYRRYLGDQLRHALAEAKGRVTLSHVRARASDIRLVRGRGPLSLSMISRRFRADHVVLGDGCIAWQTAL